MSRYLIAPSGYMLDPEAGSEIGMATDLIRGLSIIRPHQVEFASIVGISNIQSIAGFSIYEIGRCYTSPYLGPLRFYSKLTRKALSVGFPCQFSLLHHCLPYSLDVTVSPLFLFAMRADIPYVVGWVQIQQQFAPAFPIWATKDRLTWLADDLLRFGVSKVQGILRMMSNYFLRHANVVIVPGEMSREKVEQRGVDKSKIVVIPFPVPAIECKGNVVLKTSGRRKFEVLYTGILNERKCVDKVIQGFHMFSKHKSDVRLTLVGDGPEREKLQTMVKELGIGEKVRFVGWVPRRELAEFYQYADVFLTMSRSETWSMSCAEAMVYECVVVSADNDGIKEYLQHGVTGMLVGKDDISALSTTPQLLYGERQLRSRIGRSARQWVLENCDMVKVAQKVLHAYSIAEIGLR